MNTITIDDLTTAIELLSAHDRERLERWFYTHPFGNDEKRLEGHVAEPTTAYLTSPEHRRLSVDEYLALEADGPTRQEYIDGEVFAMAGATRRHNRIAGNLFNAFSNHLREGPCEAFMTDFKVRLQIHRKEIFYYPDVMVACGREGMDEYYLTHPKLIAEVLSPSTQATDVREKALNYRQLPSLEEYVLVDQDRCEVIIQRRTANWEPVVLTSIQAVADFQSLELALPLSGIYQGA